MPLVTRSIPVSAMPLRATAVVLTVCVLLASGCGGASLTHPELIADSVGEFGGRQGANGWSYGYWDRSADADKSYDPKVDFQLLEHFGSDPLNGLSGHPDFTTGDLWYLKDGVYYTSLWAEGGHANTTLELGAHAQREQWAIRRWISTTEGPVSIAGHAGKVMPWGENWSGGVLALIVVDGKELFRTDIGKRSTDYSINAMVQAGSRVEFLIGPNPSVGVTKFTATIRTTPGASR